VDALSSVLTAAVMLRP